MRAELLATIVVALTSVFVLGETREFHETEKCQVRFAFARACMDFVCVCVRVCACSCKYKFNSCVHNFILLYRQVTKLCTSTVLEKIISEKTVTNLLR